MNENAVQNVFRQQVSYCGKPTCRRCREGQGHGPYWYAYQTVDGRTTRTYIGHALPPEVSAKGAFHSWHETTIVHLASADGTTFSIPMTERQYAHFMSIEASGPIQGKTFAQRFVELLQLVEQHGLSTPQSPSDDARKEGHTNE